MLFVQLVHRTHLMNQSMSPLKQSATELLEPGYWVILFSRIKTGIHKILANVWCGGVNSLLPVCLSCATFQSSHLLSSKYPGERSPFKRDKKGR